MKSKVAVVGLGNTGLYAIKALAKSGDLECAGVIRRAAGAEIIEGVKQYNNIDEMPVKPEVVILCLPSKNMPETAGYYLSKGISVVDSFDIHSEVYNTVNKLDKTAKANNAAAVVSAGWDPGSDSMIRAVFKALDPHYPIYTNFGPGMSMGHSVVAKSVKGVKDAVSITLPLEKGKHKRLVYVELDGSQTKEQVYDNMRADDYFAHDPLEIEVVPKAADYKDASHGGNVHMEGDEITADFKMTVNNPKTTAHVLVACARAALRIPPGAYTVIDLPLVTLLEGTREENIKKLV
ncbi:Semialdehyde dehydrogenase [Elusimicrobium minutum Pei191]|uniref:Meso-diaminopimelate D-dehydrogenase n=1 Tax=Elusimicrobium minutum (strain Pei191) TaxID=445932 RepID=B2KDK5_ELUMP|nr:diaminopimelate dehydrogenase [Elusimicrobium minutum]ACC98601.1 Semialdehyde dehydrogenase [Elusimicrobium minutum Pei191]